MKGLLVSLLLLTGVSCQRQETAAAAFTVIDSQGGGELTLGGVHWEFDGSVHYVYRFQSGTGIETETEMTVDGHPFGMRGDTVFVGEREYGTAASGSLVSVTSAGVTVDGEFRGPLPAAR